ncbi:L-fucose/L-arabinose isomerase family protein [Shimia abyssi]|uniref:L-fucose isomerase-like protein n=1 Tax=Shimia abyssi TaxID=1662395 RepID=A0A2P8F9P1_9RHOB|nr:hypothetical protein [Shimia abyssi]PSL18443.1 L-fucose isomerase-like protein [Shimia abyssi]
MKLGILPLARPTFDVAYAESKLAAMLAVLDASGHELCGPRVLLMDDEAAGAAIDTLQQGHVDAVLVLQVTFTDASFVVSVANAFEQALHIWAVPEPRLGGRLRLNAFCGLNLASHALRRNGRDFGWLYADPEADVSRDVQDLLTGARGAGHAVAAARPEATDAGRAVAEAVKGNRIARIGAHPVGFDTCAYDANAIRDLAQVGVDAIELDDLFDKARNASDERARALRNEADQVLSGLEDVDQAQLDRSLRLKAGLDTLRAEGAYDAFAIRCWPETFTEYGGAVCGPAGMLGEARVPCACEADVYGALTQLILMQAADAPVFLTDIVDMDAEDDTGVVWHCGQAPMSMRDPAFEAEATVHTNRKQPLLFQFPLKPGTVTMMRISQADGVPSMVLAKGEMQARPMAFTGTSGVLKFTRPTGEVLDRMIECGLEHHMALAYGDHIDTLRGVAGAMNLPVLEL